MGSDICILLRSFNPTWFAGITTPRGPAAKISVDLSITVPVVVDPTHLQPVLEGSKVEQRDRDPETGTSLLSALQILKKGPSTIKIAVLDQCLHDYTHRTAA